MGKIIGIDLGTTYSAMAFLEGGKAEIIPNAEGARTTPSVVAFSKDGELLVGEVAKRQAVVNPENTIYSVKRLMGRAFNEVEEEMARVPYGVEAGDNSKPLILLPNGGDKKFSPEEVSAFILQKMRKDAEAFLGEEVTQAVITVPAYFNDSQRQATKDAGRIAGLEVLRIVNEPTASSLAYGLDKSVGQTVLVFDLGGGTFDVTVLEFGDGVFEVKATHGDNHLGGDDFDGAIMQYLAEEFQRQHNVDLMKDRTAVQRLKEAAEKAKKELSSVAKTNVNLPYIAVTADGPKHIDVDLTRAKFEELVRPLVERCRGPVEQALKDANLDASGLDEIILVGGSTRIPAVHNLVKELTGKEPNKTVNPDEAVALGAAIQGGVISGEVTDLLLLDVTPLSLGIETLGGVFTKLIERNTTIPTKKSKIFSTAADMQTSVEVHVLQGERSMASDNKSLGRFHLDGIPPSPRGVPQIEVAFDIDANGILNVSAKDLGTGKQQKITVTGSTRLTDSEVEQATEDAQKYAEEDEKRVEVVNARNDLDNLCYAAERSIQDAGKNVPQELTEKVQKAVANARGNLQSDDPNELKRHTEDLSKAVQELGAAIYARAQGASTEAPKQDATGAAGPAGAAAAAGAGPAGAHAGAENADDFTEFETVDPSETEFETEEKPETRTKKGEGPDGIDVDYDVKTDE